MARERNFQRLEFGLLRFAHTPALPQAVAARGFLAPGGKCHICRPQAHDILWGCIERTFFLLRHTLFRL
jgi:hypothetical protein